MGFSNILTLMIKIFQYSASASWVGNECWERVCKISINRPPRGKRNPGVRRISWNFIMAGRSARGHCHNNIIDTVACFGARSVGGAKIPKVIMQQFWVRVGHIGKDLQPLK